MVALLTLALGVLALHTAGGAAEAAAPTGVVKVISTPPGAIIKVDGRPRGATPALLELPAGSHTITLEKDGYSSTSREVVVVQDRVARATVKLAASPPETDRPPRPARPVGDEISVHEDRGEAEPGTVTIVTTPPGLTVFMGDYLVPQPTPVAFDLRAGIYELSIEDNGEVVHRKTVFVQAGRTLALDLTIRKVRRIDYGDPWE